MTDETEAPAAMLPADVTVKTFKDQLSKTRSEYGLIANVRGDIGLVFTSMLEKQKDDESPAVIHLPFETAKQLERSLRRMIRSIEDGKVGHKLS